MFSPVVFEGSEATNMTAHFGSTAMLACRIRNNVEDNPVRWEQNINLNSSFFTDYHMHMQKGFFGTFLL